eukprot:2411460-Rhodomonas_salina.1
MTATLPQGSLHDATKETGRVASWSRSWGKRRGRASIRGRRRRGGGGAACASRTHSATPPPPALPNHHRSREHRSPAKVDLPEQYQMKVNVGVVVELNVERGRVAARGGGSRFGEKGAVVTRAASP